MRMQLASKIHYKTDDEVFVLPTVASFEEGQSRDYLN